MEIEELQGWAVYLNSPYCRQVQEDLRAGWLVHVIRNMMRGKGQTPKFKDSMPPIHEIMRDFFKEKSQTPVWDKMRVLAAVEEAKLEMRKEERLWNEGKVMRGGLYIGEELMTPAPMTVG